MFQFKSLADFVNDLARQSVESKMTDEQFIVAEIERFRNSKQFKAMVDGNRYYSGKHDILNKRRTVIGEDGKLTVVENLPNNKIVDNQYKKMVDQKVNYLVGQPFILRSKNDAFVEALKPYIQTKKFLKLMIRLSV